MRLEEIRHKYDLSNTNLEDIKSELKKLIKDNHPDNTESYDIEFFTQLNEDLEYVEDLLINKEDKEVLVPMSEVMKTMADIINFSPKFMVSETDRLKTELTENINVQLDFSKKRWKGPRIGTATALAIVTFIWMFPERVMSHPLIDIAFGNILSYDNMLTITMIWLLVLCATIYLWWISYKSERVEKAIVERVKLESVQNQIFQEFITKLEKRRFSKIEFMTFIRRALLNVHTRVRKIVIQEAVIQNVADIILLRAEKYEVIKKVNGHSLIDYYEIIE